MVIFVVVKVIEGEWVMIKEGKGCRFDKVPKRTKKSLVQIRLGWNLDSWNGNTFAFLRPCLSTFFIKKEAVTYIILMWPNRT